MEHTEAGPGRTPVACGRGEAVERRGDLIELRVVDSVALVRLNRPVVAAVNGTAIAGGFELVLACDVVFAAAEVRMGDGHLRYGVLPGGGGAVRLERKIPANAARRLRRLRRLRRPARGAACLPRPHPIMTASSAVGQRAFSASLRFTVHVTIALSR